MKRIVATAILVSTVLAGAQEPGVMIEWPYVGAEVWRGATQFRTYANPMTYRARSGRQFVVIATGSGSDAALVAFSRPK